MKGNRKGRPYPHAPFVPEGYSDRDTFCEKWEIRCLQERTASGWRLYEAYSPGQIRWAFAPHGIHTLQVRAEAEWKTFYAYFAGEGKLYIGRASIEEEDDMCIDDLFRVEAIGKRGLRLYDTEGVPDDPDCWRYRYKARRMKGEKERGKVGLFLGRLRAKALNGLRELKWRCYYRYRGEPNRWQ